MARARSLRVAILGAGPIGVEAALYAAKLQIPVTLYERGEVGAHLRQWGHVRLFSPFGMNVTTLGMKILRDEMGDADLPEESECVTGHRHLEAYLEPLSKTSLLEDVIQEKTDVLQIGRRGFLKTQSPGSEQRAKEPFILHLRNEKGEERFEEADVILDCTGTYGQHRWMGMGGIPALGERKIASAIAYGLEDVTGTKRESYSGRTTLVIGSGYSAATTICRLADLAAEDDSTWIIWLTRNGASQPIKRIANDPLKERDRLAMWANTLATRAEGNVEHHSRVEIEKIETTDEGFRVHGRSGGEAKVWEVERVIANVGFTPDTELYRELQVHECYATLGPMSLSASLMKQGNVDCLKVSTQGANVLRNPEPGFFIIGSKSYGRSSNFLLRNGYEQVRDVFTLITGDPKLNLY